MDSGIYIIRNKITGACYVGSAGQSFRTRWNHHKYLLRHGRHHSTYMQRSWDVHGESCFEFAIQEECISSNDLLKREQYWIDELKPVYNMAHVAGRPMAGRKLSPEHRRKLHEGASRANKCEKSAEHRLALSLALRGRIPWNKGIPHSEATKARISSARAGKATHQGFKQLPCKVCERKGYCKNLCLRHYYWARRHGGVANVG